MFLEIGGNLVETFQKIIENMFKQLIMRNYIR